MSKVIIVPGNFASTLTRNGHLLWLNPVAMLEGGFEDMRLGAYTGPFTETEANPNNTIKPIGTLPFLYSLLENDLRFHGFDVHVFPYDFRKDTDFLAMELIDFIASFNGKVSLITHSQGGLVCRRAIQLNQAANVDRLIMMAPSISGTLVAAIALAGALQEVPFVGSLPMIGASPQPILKTFSALYQLLPWNETIMPSLSNPAMDIRKMDFWGNLIDTIRFIKLSTYGSMINTDFFNNRMNIILGSGHPTAGGVKINNGELTVDHAYDLPGDGFMAQVCSTIPGVKTDVFPGIGHLSLPMDIAVIHRIIGILRS